MKREISYSRYSRQITLKGFGEEGQRKLLQAKAVVVGAGGLGCPALQYLVAAGVGTVGIVDDDVVSLSNLHRQILYTTDDIGSSKVAIAASKLSRLNPEVVIIPYAVRLENRNALSILPQYDIVIDGTDNFASRYLINDACVLLNKPLIYGAVSRYEGQVAVFNSDLKTGERAVNCRDLFPEPPKYGEVTNCAEAGVLGVLPGIIGTMQAAEAIKLITGIGKPLQNRLLTYNVLTNEMYEVKVKPSIAGTRALPKDEGAFLITNYTQLCAANESSVVEIDAAQFHFFRSQPSSVVIDVRERGELPAMKNVHHRQIPMSVFQEQLSTIEEETVILFCQHGIRSLHAAELLREVFGASKQVYSLKGGVVEWEEELILVGSKKSAPQS